MLLHPEVGTRRCEDCRKWLYNEQTGEQKRDRDGNPLPRPSDVPVRCETSRGCPRGTPDDEMQPHNWRCLFHYQQCQAIGQFPQDAIVRENAAILRGIFDEFSRIQQRRQLLATERLNKLIVAWLKAQTGA